MSHEPMQSIVEDGRERAHKASIATVRAEVEREFAPVLSKAGFLRWIVLRIRIKREIERRMDRIAPPDALYSHAEVCPDDQREG